MSILLYPPPETVPVGGRIYPIKTDFRTGIQFEQMIQNGEIEPKQLTRMVLDLWFPWEQPEPQDIGEAMKVIANFYLCGLQKENIEDAEKTENVGNTERCYDFLHDAEYIFAAFWQQYGVDLTKSEMHWWVFRALFAGLTDACTIVKIMGYRSAPITDDMASAEKDHLKRMKELYALPRPEKEIEEEDLLDRVLMGSGDLAEYFALGGT